MTIFKRRIKTKFGDGELLACTVCIVKERFDIFKYITTKNLFVSMGELLLNTIYF